MDDGIRTIIHRTRRRLLPFGAVCVDPQLVMRQRDDVVRMQYTSADDQYVQMHISRICCSAIL